MRKSQLIDWLSSFEEDLEIRFEGSEFIHDISKLKVEEITDYYDSDKRVKVIMLS